MRTATGQSCTLFWLASDLTLTNVIEPQLLDQVHQTFYDAYELSQVLKRPTSPITKKGKRRPSIVDEDAPLYDVKVKNLSFLLNTNDFADWVNTC